MNGATQELGKKLNECRHGGRNVLGGGRLRIPVIDRVLFAGELSEVR